MMRKLGFAVVPWILSVCGCVAPQRAQAQFIGYTSPQTVQQQLGAATNTCNGSAQDYTVSNLGQTEHYVTVNSNATATQLTVNIFGVTVNGSHVNISDELDMAGAQVGSLFASGYFPSVIVEVTCQPNTTIYTLTYSGVWATPPAKAGNFLQTQIDKEIYAGISGDGGLSHALIPPFGSSAGDIYFKFLSGNVAGSTLNVICSGGLGGGAASTIVLSGQAIANNTNLQAFPVSNIPCPLMTIQYNSGGNGSSVYLSYRFGTPGISNWTLATP